VATEPTTRPALAIIEPASAATAPLPIVIDDLIDLILGPQLATRAARASARRCARDFGGSIDSGTQLVRES
jgi:hypothetical protein